MPYYRVRLNGRNIVLAIDGRRDLHGFWTTRLVQAGSPEAAAEEALERVQQEPALKEPLNGPDDPCPVVLVDEVEEVASFDGLKEFTEDE